MKKPDIRKFVVNEVRKVKALNESASITALERLNAAFNEFMDAGGTLDELISNAEGFVYDWESETSARVDQFRR